MQALEGLRVIDMATVLAGPGAARYLADFGADVVKVESPEGDAVVGAFAVMLPLRHRGRTGEGQVIDVNLLESMLQCMGALPSVWAQRGELQPRLGSGIPYTVPRGTYRCADGVWVAVSTSTESVARRVLALIGIGGDERFGTFAGRMEHRDELEGALAGWIVARPSADVLAAFEAAHAA